jgi:hypothetical protein
VPGCINQLTSSSGGVSSSTPSAAFVALTIADIVSANGVIASNSAGLGVRMPKPGMAGPVVAPDAAVRARVSVFIGQSFPIINTR